MGDARRVCEHCCYKWSGGKEEGKTAGGTEGVGGGR